MASNMSLKTLSVLGLALAVCASHPRSNFMRGSRPRHMRIRCVVVQQTLCA
ncbi:hypothetical protein Pyn_11777 [Prunus yedoensis var. nudiflora]|uniref:Uncharacterized protein n=1 Tax=Prunus yedoensis var. nudiflora TaxID=2094558 RepID=A0A314XGE2_PRUYE|nr:hypothetical protein Pyn_11777 [Prunus yedoensis var. nudiflora]